MSNLMSNRSREFSPQQVAVICNECDRIEQAVLSNCPGLTTLLRRVVEMRLAGATTFEDKTIDEHRNSTTVSGHRENLRRLRQHVAQFYAMTPSSEVRIAFDSSCSHPFVPQFCFGYVDPKPDYRAALILGEQRTEPGIMAAIDRLLKLREAEHGITAWGAVGLVDQYSRKAIYVSPVEVCPEDLRLAHKYADEAIRNMPAAVSYIRKGLLCTDDRMIADAKHNFDHAMKVDQLGTRLSHEYVTFLAATGRFDEAIACSIEAIARNEERRTHSINLGEVYYMADRLKEAREQLERAEREYPDAWVAASLQGLIAMTEGRNFAMARRHFDRARGLPRQGRLRTILRCASELTQALIDHRSVISSEKRNRVPGLRLVEFAVFYVLDGRLADSLSVLETLVSCRYPAMSCMIQWPIFAPLHANPRFQEIRTLWTGSESEEQRNRKP